MITSQLHLEHNVGHYYLSSSQNNIFFLNSYTGMTSFFHLCHKTNLHLVPVSLGAIKKYILYASHFEHSINVEHLLPNSLNISGWTWSTSTAIDFLSTLACSFFLLSFNWDTWYTSQCSVDLLFLFPTSISVSLLLTAGAPSTIFDVAPSASKLIKPSLLMIF